MFGVYWKSGPSKGYCDLLPNWWFDEEGEKAALTHDTRTPSKARFAARCSLKVEGNVADFNYGGAHAAYNEGRLLIGIMRLIFTDGSRTQIGRVEWRSDEQGAGFEEVDTIAADLQVPIEMIAFDPTDIEDGRRRIERMITVRQGQPASAMPS